VIDSNGFNRLCGGGWAVASALALWVSLGFGPAWAGSRAAEVVVVRIDDGSDPGSAACHTRVLTHLKQGEVNFYPVKRAVFLERAGMPDGAGLLTWTAEQVAKGGGVPKAAGQVDAIIVIDCRPGVGVLRAVMVGEGAPRLGIAPTLRFEVGGPINRLRMELLGATLTHLVWRDINY